MKKRIVIVSILIGMGIFMTSCSTDNKVVEDPSSLVINQAESDRNNPSSQSDVPNSKENQLLDTDVRLTIKDCEYKAIQTIVNMFGQMEVSDLGEYDFRYFTEKGKTNYNEYRKMFQEEKLTAIGKNFETAGDLVEEDKITIITWFAYENSIVRTRFQMFFIRQDDKWLIDYIELDS